MSNRFVILILVSAFCFACDFEQEPIVNDTPSSQIYLDSGTSDGSSHTIVDSGTSDGSSSTIVDSGTDNGSSNTIVDSGTDNGFGSIDIVDGGTEGTDWSVGHTADSCGSPYQGLTPVDCTVNGDVSAFCVYSNHCACTVTDGYTCENSNQFGDSNGVYVECAPGSVCVLAEISDGGIVDDNDFLAGSTATSCGSPSQGLTPVDCTVNGDVNAICAFSSHCVCSLEDGFRCEVADPNSTLGGLGEECEPGSVCVDSVE